MIVSTAMIGCACCNDLTPHTNPFTPPLPLIDTDYQANLDKVRAWKVSRAAAAAKSATYHVHSWTDGNVLYVSNGGLETGKETRKSNEDPGTPCPPERLDPTDNLGKAVLEVQIRLYCYRKVVHKRFIDQIACYLRLQFPRALREAFAVHLRRAVLSPVIDDGDNEPPISLVSLMAEPSKQRNERDALVSSIKRLEEAGKELKRGNLRAFLPATTFVSSR